MKEKLNALLDKLKKAYRSKVIWFNTVIAALIPIMPELIQQAVDAIPQLQPYLPDDTYKFLTFVGLMGNIYLRFKTNVSLAHK